MLYIEIRWIWVDYLLVEGGLSTYVVAMSFDFRDTKG